MKIDIVDFSGGGEASTALYVDGKYLFGGDCYHDKIDDYVEGFLAGVKKVRKVFPNQSEVKYHSLTEAAAEKFAETGDSFPKKFPFKKYKLEVGI